MFVDFIESNKKYSAYLKTILHVQDVMDSHIQIFCTISLELMTTQYLQFFTSCTFLRLHVKLVQSYSVASFLITSSDILCDSACT